MQVVFVRDVARRHLIGAEWPRGGRRYVAGDDNGRQPLQFSLLLLTPPLPLAG
jgi:hypothetical protein